MKTWQVRAAAVRQAPRLANDAPSSRTTRCALQVVCRGSRTLTISGGHFTAAGFHHLTGLRHLRRLGLVSWHRPSHSHSSDPLVTWLGSERAVEVTDEDLAEVGKLTGLDELRVASTRITDAGLAHLAGLSKLKTLELGATAVTSAGIEHLAKLKNIQMVKLYCARLSDEGLRFVAQWPQLRHLELYQTTVDGSGFAHFASDSKLESVYISGAPNVSDQAISHLARLANLTQLQLYGTRVTGANLGQLQAAPKLSALCISPGVEVDETRLRSQLPKCSILRIRPTDRVLKR